MDEIYPFLSAGELLQDGAPNMMRRWWEQADAGSFQRRAAG